MKSDIACLIRRKQFSDSKWIITVLTSQHGIRSFVCRVSSKEKFLLEPFRRLSISWSGDSDLAFASSVSVLNTFDLSVSSSIAVYKLHELIMSHLMHDESASRFFDTYIRMLEGLSNKRFLAQDVVWFELSLLCLCHAVPDMDEVKSDCSYRITFVGEEPVLTMASGDKSFSGEFLLSVNNSSGVSKQYEADARKFVNELLSIF